MLPMITDVAAQKPIFFAREELVDILMKEDKENSRQFAVSSCQSTVSSQQSTIDKVRHCEAWI